MTYPYALLARRDDRDPSTVHRQLMVVTSPELLPKAPPLDLPPALAWFYDDLRLLMEGSL